MTTKIISVDEIKQILGISGTSKDGLIYSLNKIATEQLVNMLEVSDLGVHTIIKETIKPTGCFSFFPQDFPVDVSEPITLYSERDYEYSDYYFTREANMLFSINSVDSSGFPKALAQEENYRLSYTAGYTVQDTIKIDTNPNDGETIMIENLGVEIIYTFKTSPSDPNDIEIGGDQSATASNIADKITGSTVTTDTVTLPLGYTAAYGTASTITITNATIPADLKATVAYLVGGMQAEQNKMGGVVSYRIGTKQVNFRSESEQDFTVSTLEKYASFYRRASIMAV